MPGSDSDDNLLGEIEDLLNSDSDHDDVVGQIEDLLDDPVVQPPADAKDAADATPPASEPQPEPQQVEVQHDRGSLRLEPLDAEAAARRDEAVSPLTPDPVESVVLEPEPVPEPAPEPEVEALYTDEDLMEEILDDPTVEPVAEPHASEGDDDDLSLAEQSVAGVEAELEAEPEPEKKHEALMEDILAEPSFEPLSDTGDAQTKLPLQTLECKQDTEPGQSDASGRLSTSAADKYRVVADGEEGLYGEEDDEEPPRYAETSCGMSRNNKIRRAARTVMEYSWFGTLSLTIIACNCITLAAWDPTDPDNDTLRNQVLDYLEKSWTAFFFCEMCLKITAMGFVGSGSYLGDSWNRLDFVIVLVGIVDFLPLSGGGGFLTALRPLRVARPLRTINKFPAIRVLVSLIGDTLPALAAVGLLCFFIFFVFGILAVQLWNGLFHQRCYNSSMEYYHPDDPYVCTIPSLDQDGMQSCAPDIVLYGSGAQSYSTCLANGPNPWAGLVHFDNIFGAWVAIFQCITLEAWVDIMYLVQDGYSFWIFPYFILLIVTGAWFAIQLMLVVITAQFGATKEAQMDQIEAELEKARLEKEEIEYRENRRPHKSLIRTCINCLVRKKEVLTEKQLIKEDAIVAMETVEAEVDELEDKEAPSRVRRRAALLVQLAKMRDDFKLLLAEDEQAEIDRRLAIFDTIDTDQTGQVDSVKWEAHVKQYSVYNEKDRAQLFKTMDKNGNGKINKQEFLDGYDCYLESYKNTFELYRLKLRRLVLSDVFGNVIMGCIVVNVLFMAIEHDGQPAGLENTLEITNLIFTLIFTFEMCLILTAIGPLEYLEDGFRIFDGCIVILSLVELTTGGGGGLSVLRTFRLVRVFRLISFLPALQRQLGVMLQTVMDVSAFLLLLFLFMYIYAILGMILFGGKAEATTDFVHPRDDNRKNFDSFFWALVTVFQTLTQEDWNQGMIETAEATSGFACLYFIFLIVLGNYILFNLFVAIIIDGFASEATEEDEITEGEAEATAGEGKEDLDPVVSKENPLTGKLDSDSHEPCGSGSGGPVETQISVLSPIQEEPQEPSPRTKPSAKVAPEPAEGEEPPEPEEEHGPRWDHSLWLFGPDHAVRKLMIRIMASPRFEQVVMTTILINSVFIAIERPSIGSGSTERVVLDAAGYVFGGVFLVEFVVKVLAMNFWFGPDPYIAQGWNKLDGFLVFVSVLDLVLTLADVSGGSMLRMLKIFRMFRTLRPLRAISKLPGLRAVVETLLASIKPIGSTLIIIATFFFIFGILGTQLFLGKLYFCDGVGDAATFAAVNTKDDCLAQGLEWKRHEYNFDNLGQALMALFVIASIDGWVDIMYSGVDAVDKDREPIANNQPVMVIFFAAFILIGGFFILNMFVGVILENFQAHMKAEKEAAAALKEQQIADGTWVEPVPEGTEEEEPYWEDYPEWRQKLTHHVRSAPFESFIAIVILLNVGSMAMEHYEMSSEFKLFLEILNYIFTTIFLYEAGAKLTALGWGRYMCGPDASWNRFDFFICFISVVGIVLDNVGDVLPLNPTLLRVLRILRVARILKLLKGAEELRRLLETVRRSLAQAGNLGLLLFLLFFIFAALGIELFGRLTWKDGCNENYPCEGFSIHANFEDFPTAMLTLFRLSTGDNWNGMMKDSLREPPACSDDSECTSNCCSNGVIGQLFFIFFILTAQFVMLNLVVAVLMKELDNAREEQKLEAALAAAEEAAAAAEDADVELTRKPKRSKTALEETMAEGGKYWGRRFDSMSSEVLQGRRSRPGSASRRNASRRGSEVGITACIAPSDSGSVDPMQLQTGQTDHAGGVKHQAWG